MYFILLFYSFLTNSHTRRNLSYFDNEPCLTYVKHSLHLRVTAESCYEKILYIFLLYKVFFCISGNYEAWFSLDKLHSP